MKTWVSKAILVIAAVALFEFEILAATPMAAETPRKWIGSWGASLSDMNHPGSVKRTARQYMRLSIGGCAVRIRLSNAVIENPLQPVKRSPLGVHAARVARPGKTPGSIDPNTDHVITFNGMSSVIVRPGETVVSDPVEWAVESLETLAISLSFSQKSPVPSHPLGQSTMYFTAENVADFTAAETLPNPHTSGERFFVTAIEVDAPDASGTVVVLGDSITDGDKSTPDVNRRWPDVLAERLAARNIQTGVVNAGIAGNRVLEDAKSPSFGPSALARFDRDVLSVAGVHSVILMEGVNDLGMSSGGVTADALIAGLSNLADAARKKGLRVFGATLTPFANPDTSYYTQIGEQSRQTINNWIRESGRFDEVIDFDLALKDQKMPERLATEYDSGDGVHLSDAGYRKMAESVDLADLSSD